MNITVSVKLIDLLIHYQNKFIRVEPTGGDFWDYLPFIAVVVSSVSLGVSIAFWVLKIL